MSPRFAPVVHGVRWDDTRCGFSPTGEHSWTLKGDDFFVLHGGIRGCTWCLAICDGEGTRIRERVIPDPLDGTSGHLSEAAIVFEIESIA